MKQEILDAGWKEFDVTPARRAEHRVSFEKGNYFLTLDTRWDERPYIELMLRDIALEGDRTGAQYPEYFKVYFKYRGPETLQALESLLTW